MRTRVPSELKSLSEWGWRIIVLLILSGVSLFVISKLEVVVVGVFVGLLLAAFLMPLLNLFTKVLPRGLSTFLTLLTSLLVLTGLVFFVANQVAADLGSLQTQFLAGVDEARGWLASGPLHISDAQTTAWIMQGQEFISDKSAALTSGALSTAAATGEILTGSALAIFSCIFFLYDGTRIWQFVVNLLPGKDSTIKDVGSGMWKAMAGYVRGTVVIAFADAVLIGIALVILDVPLSGPLAVLVFLGAFIPIVGAFGAGIVAAAVALATGGVVTSLIVVGVIVVVQQLEGHILQPVVMNKAVNIHPLAVALAVASGALLAGVIGAVVAVPVAAMLNSGIRAYLKARSSTVGSTAVILSAEERALDTVHTEEATRADALVREVAEKGATETSTVTSTAPQSVKEPKGQPPT